MTRVLEHISKNGLDLKTAVVGILASAGGKLADLLKAGVLNVLQRLSFFQVSPTQLRPKATMSLEVNVITVPRGSCYHADIFGLQLRARVDTNGSQHE